jgi:hypothetical protein
MTDSKEQEERLAAVRNAVATVRLAGQEIDPERLVDLHRVASGELDLADLKSSLFKRIAAGEFRY